MRFLASLRAFGVAALLGISSVAHADFNTGRYNLVSGQNAAGTTTPVNVEKNPYYIFSCVATSWGGASAQIQALGPDGATWLTGGVSALTSNGVVTLSLGTGSLVEVVVTGTPTGLYCALS